MLLCRFTLHTRLNHVCRFMNVVLKDVEEEYTVRVRVMRTLQGRGDSAGATASETGTSEAARKPGSREGRASASSECAPAQGGGKTAVVLRPTAVSADVDPVEPGELGEVAVPVEKVGGRGGSGLLW